MGVELNLLGKEKIKNVLNNVLSPPAIYFDIMSGSTVKSCRCVALRSLTALCEVNVSPGTPPNIDI